MVDDTLQNHHYAFNMRDMGLLPLSWSEIVGAPCPTTLDDAFGAASAEESVAGPAPAPASSAESARERGGP